MLQGNLLSSRLALGGRLASEAFILAFGDLNGQSIRVPSSDWS
jgi:hypothetical protein